MDDLISRKAAIEAVRGLQIEPDSTQYIYSSDAIGVVKNVPSVDAVPVVRCRDCVEWEAPTKAEQNEGETFWHCRCRFGTCYGQQTDMNWFCADGERNDA